MTCELTYQYLSETFDLDEETGVLRWRHRPEHHFVDKPAYKRWNTRYAFTEAGSTAVDGYVIVKIRKVGHGAHRVVFAIHKKIGLNEVPDLLDHADGNPSNNRPGNLRSASSRNNAYNRLANSTKYGGAKGAYFDQRSGNWVAKIMAATGDQIHLGIFNTKEEAAAAYIGAAIIIHGEFFRDPRTTQAAA
jgi:hypothetical protein